MKLNNKFSSFYLLKVHDDFMTNTWCVIRSASAKPKPRVCQFDSQSADKHGLFSKAINALN